MDTCVDERLLLRLLDEDYLLATTRELMADEIVAGSPEELAHAERIAHEMRWAGLHGGSGTHTFIEEFPVAAWRERGSSVTVMRPEKRMLACKHGYRGDGTDPEGVRAAIVDVASGGRSDFERDSVQGKIVLVEQGPSWSDPMAGLPALMEAKSRGAVGALIHAPAIAVNDVRADPIAPSIPAVHVRHEDCRYLQRLLGGQQEVVARLIVENEPARWATGHNVIGMIPGHSYPEEYVYLSAHHDHWFPEAGASDDCAGVATLLTIARAFRKAGVSPPRSVVFCAWGAEEAGGPTDSFYDWCVGSCSHIMATLRSDGSRGPALNPERVGRTAAMLNMDEVGSRGGMAQLQATPDLLDFYSGVAREIIGEQRMTAGIDPPAAYDNWPFYTAGVPCANIAWRGEAHDAVMHTARDTLEKLDPEHLRLNAAFNAVALMRLAHADVPPYSPLRNYQVGKRGIDAFVARPRAIRTVGDAGLERLRGAIAEYGSAAERFEARCWGERTTRSDVAAVNASLMEAAARLNPHLYFCDLRTTPAWSSSFVLEQYGHDLECLTEAIRHLRADRREAAARALTNTTAMSWGHKVGQEAYERTLDLVYHTPHKWWAQGFVRELATVHREFTQLAAAQASAVEMRQVADALVEKREAVARWAEGAADRTGLAYGDAAAVLGSIDA